MTCNDERQSFSIDGVFGTISLVPAFEDRRNERMLLSYDATGERDYPETGWFGYLYVFGLSNDWIKVGRTGYWDKRCGDSPSASPPTTSPSSSSGRPKPSRQTL